MVSVSLWYLKKLGDLKLKILIPWIVQLYDVQLKLKFCSDDWIHFLIWDIWIEFAEKNWIEKGQSGTKTQLPKPTIYLVTIHLQWI